MVVAFVPVTAVLAALLELETLEFLAACRLLLNSAKPSAFLMELILPVL